MHFKWGLLFFVLISSAAWSQVPPIQQSILDRKDAAIDFIEISALHRNDFDFLGGNDQGETFSNQILARWFNEHENHPQELYAEIGNRFFTERQAGLEATALERYSNKDLNYLEEFELVLGAKRDLLPIDPEAGPFEFRPFGQIDLTFGYLSSNKSPFGSTLQKDAHQEIGGVKWTYENNRFDEEEFNLDFSCRLGTEFRATEYITCEAYFGGTLRVTDPQGSTIDTGASIRLHTRAPSWFDRRRPTFSLVSEIECETMPENGEKDLLLRLGAETNVPIGGSRIRCQILWQEALDVNESTFHGLQDDDGQLQILMGVIF